MSRIFETSTKTATKAEASTIEFQSAMEKKLDNIMHRLKNRFDKETHRANNERIVHEYRTKMRLRE